MFDKQQIQAAILELLEAMEKGPVDAREIQTRLRQLMDQMRATGMPIPKDLIELDQKLAQNLEDKAAGEQGNTEYPQG